MTPEFFVEYVLRPALRWLPRDYRSREAEALITTIALQESGLRHRAQVRGPARGLHQWELNGVRGVLTHDATRAYARDLCDALLVETSGTGVHRAIEHNDFLGVVFARLLLWTVPEALPRSHQVEEAWDQYTWAWRPGKPHRERWDANWKRAWEAVERA